MVRLCQNRPEGFGPHSALHPSIPTTCFLDVVVEPLASWLFILLCLALLPMRVTAWRSPLYSKSSHHLRPSIISRVLSTAYYLLIVAMLAMLSLELARLVAAELGIGLLPFGYVGMLLAVFNRLTWRSKTARLANVVFWVLSIVAMALKTAAEQKEQDGPTRRVKDQTTQGNYPTSDEALDNGVMVGVQVLLAALEFNGWNYLS